MPSSDQDKLEADVHSYLSSHPSADKDDGYDVYTQTRGLEYTPEEAKKVLRKIDTRLIPLLVVIYMLQYLDKNSLNFASVYGLKQGTHLHGQDYAWLGSIFYFGYLIAQYPAGYALQRLPMGKALSITTIIWGALLMTTPACHNFAGIADNRFLLGLVEAVVNPGFVLLMSMWYTAQEQPLRLEAYYCTNGIATKFGDKFHSRSACMIVANSICIVGSGLLVGLPDTNKWGRLVALWLCYFQGLGFSMSLTMVSSNVAGYTKKQVTGALLFTGYCVGNIIGPQTFKESEAPGYQSAYIAMLVGYMVKLVSITALYVYMYLENRRRDRMSAEESDRDRGIENGMLNQTEIDNKQFRYVL